MSKINRTALADLPDSQRIFRFANQTCMKNELKIDENYKIIMNKIVNWNSDRTRKILEAIWIVAPICLDNFEQEVDEQFLTIQNYMKSEIYRENLNCFKYKLESFQPNSVLLIDFDRKLIHNNPSIIAACDEFLHDFYSKFLNISIESLKSDMEALEIFTCNEQTFVNAAERKKNVLKIAIVANSERVPVKYFKITKNEYKESLRSLGRNIKDCILNDIKLSDNGNY
ncbi:hypothetical protein PVAND_014611 [Polypedilum vanderplanki]|uniref:Uncharacterized protein n=1 Tax=Polypedilum vanderplanki TaxID=319348 RepID=A0A9J6B9P1_POLVA|nr:hypothetical protein PVAND_014611 [Polypedilum vanderplanki]